MFQSYSRGELLKISTVHVRTVEKKKASARRVACLVLYLNALYVTMDYLFLFSVQIALYFYIELSSVKPKLLCSNHMESIAFSEANIYLLLSSYIKVTEI